MASLEPPPSLPGVSTNDPNDPHRRFRIRGIQVASALITLLVTAWLCTINVFVAIVAIVAAKHILLAIVMMGIGVGAPRDYRV